MTTPRGGDRREFLRLAGGAAAASTLPAPIARALSLPAARRAGTIADLEHVVIFMQENRSFDHYFGTLRGVRGFGDPLALRRGGRSVFEQPVAPGSAEVVRPFHLDGARMNAQGMASLDHSWKGSHERWKGHDAWVQAKTSLTMGYFTRADLPFHYALADAFTICDAYHCSIFGPTNPNRMFLFAGTSGLAAGYDGQGVVANPPLELNESSDPARDNRLWRGFGWTTYAERLEAAGVSWRVYQEWDNYGDNALAYFANFRGALDSASPLYRKGRAWVAGSNEANAKSEAGKHLVAAFAADVAADRLPQVSWIVAPYPLCEHPSATPAAGEDLTARLIAALTANPAVWAKTAFILTYDENDGFFDHVPPLVPPVGPAPGESTVALDGESYHGEPVGLGPRVPTIVVSPWTKGGWVNSQLFDHTSIIRLLEKRFGVAEPQITPWRRALCGDFTSVFDFTGADVAPLSLPDASQLPAAARAQARLPAPKAPIPPAALRPAQEAGDRPARPLPYAFDAWACAADDGRELELTITNTGAAAAGFVLYPLAPDTGDPRFYAVEPGKVVTDRLLSTNSAGEHDGYIFDLYGPNGFYRRIQQTRTTLLDVSSRAVDGALELTLHNVTTSPIAVSIGDAYRPAPDREHRLAPGATIVERWDVSAAQHWYGLEIRVPGESFSRTLRGHVETGRPSRSDPQLARKPT